MHDDRGLADLIAEEFAKRVSAPKFRIEEFLFPEQLKFVKDPSPFKTAVCSRRSGKTVSCAADLINTALTFKEITCLYITLSRNNAKKLIWPEIKRINRMYELNGKVDNTELSITFPTGSVIYLSGAKDSSEIEKFRGLPIKLCYVDEGQSFKEYIRDLIDDIISPALLDFAGSLCLIGTPGPVPVGYFYDCSQSPAWAHHFWTFWQNPFISSKSGKTHKELLDRELKRRGVAESDPSVQREFFGRWVLDTNALVFKYSKDLNHFDALPQMPNPWSYIIGVDIGLQDADAICVIAYNRNHPVSYLIHEDVARKQDITTLAGKIEQLVKQYDPDQIVMDTGGLGAKIAEEITKRWGIPIKAAEKVRKFEFIEILNDSLRTKKLMAKASSRFAQDCMLVEWDLEKTTADKKKISDRFHSDICDAVLYAFRESLHWIHEPIIEQPKYQSPAWYQKEMEEMERAAMNNLPDHEEDPWAKPIGSWE